MRIEDVKRIIRSYANVSDAVAEIIARRLVRAYRDYNYMVDVLEQYMVPFTAKIIAEKIYEMGMKKN